MVPVWIRKAFCICLIFAIHALIAGCPFPLLRGYTESSRENLGTEITERMVVGVTTREEVLLLLGEPDGAGPNDSWLAYGSAYGEGGVGFLFCGLGGGCAGVGGEKREYQRLIVVFDELGLMTNAEFVSRECWEFIAGDDRSSYRTPPCVKINSPDRCDPPIRAIVNRETSDHGDEIFIPMDLLDFANGKAELITPGCATNLAAARAAGKNALLTKDLHDNEQWEALAKVILNDKYGDNLRWYYLGRAAEGMGLCDTASLYYGISKEWSESFITSCLGKACTGIVLPEALEGRLIIIVEKRATDKCYAPPSIKP
jgi:outer membrane protein assembly factor BamE (lipoprotein component of BamABCDE complex)